MLYFRHPAWPLGAALLLLLAGVCISQQQPYGIPSPGDMRPRYSNPTPHLGSTGYSGPPLSTALPSSGPFAQGLTAGKARSHQSFPSSAPSASFGVSRPNYVQQANREFQSLPNPISGATMSAFALHRGIYGGLRF